MADGMFIEPDVEFLKEICETTDMKKCYQCSTCTVVCPISPDVNPFPRKEMIWAQWGLKDRLMEDPDIFLCHQCNDCSEKCPRGAKPGDLLAALRSYYYKANAIPSFMGEALSKPQYLPFLILWPVFLLLVAMGIADNESFTYVGYHGIRLGDVIPGLYVVDPIFVLSCIVTYACLGKSLMKFWDDLSKNTTVTGKGMPIVEAVKETVMEIIEHRKFDECGQSSNRVQPHKFMIYSFAALFVVTGLVLIPEWLHILGIMEHSDFWHTPLPIYNPIKILAIVGGVMLILGIWNIIQNRLNDEDSTGKSAYQDWLFIWTIFTVAVTGFLTMLFRWFGVAVITYSLYFIHLVAVYMLIVYLPYSKFAHIVYRTVAIIHSKHTGRYEANATEIDIA